MKKNNIILCLVLLIFSLPLSNKASATMTTAAVLYDYCKKTKSMLHLSKQEIKKKNPSTVDLMNMSDCMGYFDGVMEGASLQSIFDGKTSRTKFNILRSCPPRNLYRNQMIKVFVKYMDDHPEKLTKKAIITVSESLAEAFPCN